MAVTKNPTTKPSIPFLDYPRSQIELHTMGLAGRKERRKLNQDPNNTKWSRDATTFGQKILRAHGWEPGQFLGAQNAAHASLHSAASAAPIKVLLKDDNLGLGAKVRQKQNDECTGLDVFKDLLGRLNGKSNETIEKERAIRSELKTSLYIERKYGPMRFVKGGLLVGDQILEQAKKDGVEDEATDVTKTDITLAVTSSKELAMPKKEKKSKKRRAEDTDDLDDLGIDQEKKKKKKKRSHDEAPSSPLKSERKTELGEKKKKDKKDKKGKKSQRTQDEDETSGVKLKTKKSKKSNGDKKANADQSDEGDNLKDSTPEDSERSKKKKKRKHADGVEKPAEASNEALVKSAGENGMSTSAETGTSTPQPMSSRHMVRSRNIASKRLAMADMAALNQIFMIKAV